MAHVTTWISVILLILAFIFFIVSIVLLEFDIGVNSAGEIVIPWYYWVFFVGSGVFVLAFVILQAIPPKADHAKDNVNTANPESWVQHGKLYTEHGKYVHDIPRKGEADPYNFREKAVTVPNYDALNIHDSRDSHNLHNSHNYESDPFLSSHNSHNSQNSHNSHNSHNSQNMMLEALNRKTYLE